jgi:hypothetical protein
MKKLLSVMLLLGLFNISCEKENSCEDQLFFDVNGIRLVNTQLKTNNGSQEQQPVLNEGTVSFNAFFLDGYFNASYYATQPKRDLSFLPKAYATTPCPTPGSEGSKEIPAGLNIIALGDYDTVAYRAGSLLNPILKINNVSVEEYLAQNKDGLKDQFFQIKFTQKPKTKSYQAFKIVMEFKDGEKHEAVTQRVLIN